MFPTFVNNSVSSYTQYAHLVSVSGTHTHTDRLLITQSGERSSIPSHCSTHDNETAYRLAKEGRDVGSHISFAKTKPITKAKEQKRWLQQHPSYSSWDNRRQREEGDHHETDNGSVPTRTSRAPRSTLETPRLPCGKVSVTVNHFLQDYQSTKELTETWPADTSLKEKYLGIPAVSIVHSRLSQNLWDHNQSFWK